MISFDKLDLFDDDENSDGVGAEDAINDAAEDVIEDNGEGFDAYEEESAAEFDNSESYSLEDGEESGDCADEAVCDDEDGEVVDNPVSAAQADRLREIREFVRRNVELQPPTSQPEQVVDTADDGEDSQPVEIPMQQYRPHEGKMAVDVTNDLNTEPQVGVETESKPKEESNMENDIFAENNMSGKAKIVVVGIGGGGNNAVCNMIDAGITSAKFFVMNTDMQALRESGVDRKYCIQLGAQCTNGLGAGADPKIGEMAARESAEQIREALQDIDLLFITAGMGGGTGTGAAPVVAEIARSMNILTVAVVTKPFAFEGIQRMKKAEDGISKLKNYVDTLLVIPNQKLMRVLGDDVSFMEAFKKADDVLRQGVQGISELIVKPALINLDFADVRTVLLNKGLAHMGVGRGAGETRIIDAVRNAVFSPLLETDIEGATAIIVNITGGSDLKLREVDAAGELIRQVVDASCNIIFGAEIDPDCTDVQITVIATGFHERVKPSFGGRVARALNIQEEKEDTRETLRLERPTQATDAPQPLLQNNGAVRVAATAENPQYGEQRTSSAQTREPILPPTRVAPSESAIPKSKVDVPESNIPPFLRRLRRKG